MSKLKKAVDLTKKILPAIKKIAPSVFNVIASAELLENTSEIAKPFVDKARLKNLEKSKIIFADQIQDGEKIIIAIEKAGLISIANSEDIAFEKFIKKIEHLRDKKILNNDKKIRKEQRVLIIKVNNILEDNGKIKDYIYRTEINMEQIKLQNEKQKKYIKSIKKLIR